MNIAVINHEEPWNLLACTSLIRGLAKTYKDCSVTFFVQPECLPILSFSKKVSVSVEEFGYENNFDLAINLTPDIHCSTFSSALSSNVIGFVEEHGSVGFSSKEVEDYYGVVYGNRKTEKHFLQILFKFCGMTWRGEGYDLSYYPKNRTKKNSIGLSISNEGLRGFVNNNLQISGSSVSTVPNRKSLLKKMDEINRYMYIITDDLFVLHASIALRKEVEFLDTTGLPYKIEFFSKGNHYGISNVAWSHSTSENEHKECSRLSS